MSNGSSRPPSNALPTLFVAPHSIDFGPKLGGGGESKVLSEDIERARARLQQNLTHIMERMAGGNPESQSFGLAQLKLRGEVVAKSSRPRKVFRVDTCPILGDWGDPGEMLVLVHPQGVKKLSERVSHLKGRDAENLINVDSLDLVEPSRRLPGTVRRVLRQEIARRGHVKAKVRAFHGDLWGSVTEQKVAASFTEVTGELHKPYLRFNHFGVYGITLQSIEQAEQLASLWFVASMDIMPVYVSTELYLADVPSQEVILDNSVDVDQLRTVLVFDGGVDPDGPLGPLIYAVEQFEDDANLDFAHGTGVAACVARRADSPPNVLIPRSRLIDVRGVPSRLSGYSLTEDSFVERLDYCAVRYGHIAEEWNLSIAAKPGPQRTTFSDIGMYLDYLHKRYGMTFFCSPGNCEPRGWPPLDATDDYVAAPGDAVCALTVGASVPSDVPPDMAIPGGAPSSFSPRGPVAHSVIKPDLIAPGGHTSGTMSHGIPILGRNGKWSTGMGTSYSTPTVTGMGAELTSLLLAGGLREHYQQDGITNIKPGLIMRALLTHRAHLEEVGLLAGNAPIDVYRGFGELPSLERTLFDPDWSSTTVIYTRLRPKQNLVMNYFPFPKSLRRGKLFWGHAIATMASDPLLNPAFRYEYVRSNVDVHFGTIIEREEIIQDKKGNEIRRLVQEPSFGIQDKFTIPRNESKLIIEEHKWSPVKKYESQPLFKCTGDFWRLKAELLLRDKESDELDADPSLRDDFAVDVVIVITIDDPLRQSQTVNSEMFAEWQLRGQVPAVLQLNPRIPLKWE